MEYLVRTLHLLALGLWLGSVTFFSFFTALPIIHHMEQLAQTPDNWVHLETKRQGTRLAGEALTPVFKNYFPFQAACGVMALGTSLLWMKNRGTLNKVRVAVLAAALALVLVNLFYLAPKVHELRIERYSADVAIAESAESAFGAWHTYSLISDMATLLLVLAGVCLAGTRFPATPRST